MQQIISLPEHANSRLYSISVPSPIILFRKKQAIIMLAPGKRKFQSQCCTQNNPCIKSYAFEQRCCWHVELQYLVDGTNLGVAFITWKCFGQYFSLTYFSFFCLLLLLPIIAFSDKISVCDCYSAHIGMLVEFDCILYKKAKLYLKIFKLPVNYYVKKATDLS